MNGKWSRSLSLTIASLEFAKLGRSRHVNGKTNRSWRVFSAVVTVLCVGAACEDDTKAPAGNVDAAIAPTNNEAAVSAPLIDGQAGTVPATADQAGTVASTAGRADVVPTDVGRAGTSTTNDVDAGTVPNDNRSERTNNAYVSNSFSNSVSVIDTVMNEVVATIPVGTAPVNPTFTPDCQQVYVSNSQADTLSVIDVNSNEVTTVPAGGNFPSGLAFTPDGKQLVVTLLGETVLTPGYVAVITLDTGEVSPLIPVDAQPERLALSKNGERAYVANIGGQTLSVIDLTRGEVVKTIIPGNLPFNVMISPDGNRVYVAAMMSNSVVVIDTKIDEIVDTITTDSPNGMAFSLDFRSMFVTNAFTGTVQEISLETNEVVRTESVGGLPGFIELAKDGKHAYFVRPDGDTVEVLDTETLTVVDTITVEAVPSVIAICHEI